MGKVSFCPSILKFSLIEYPGWVSGSTIPRPLCLSRKVVVSAEQT